MKSKTNLNLFVFCLIIGLFLTWNILGSDNFNSANLNWISSYDLKSDYLAYKFFINDKCYGFYRKIFCCDRHKIYFE